MFETIKNIIARYLFNLQGWRTDRKIVVIESDDWGSIRMPSKEAYEKCLRKGYLVNKNPYERYDSLLSQNDLESLFELLTEFRDKNGNHPVITANCVVANPDFEKIKKDNFENYHYELITETFRRYPKHANNFKIWQEGIKSNIFFPQYHGREHLNVSLFMDALRKGDRDVHFGFENYMPGCIPWGNKEKGNLYVEATNYKSIKDKEEKLVIFLEGIDLFEKLFGYKSETIIPPSYIWSTDYDKAVFDKGVIIFQVIRKMREPVPGGTTRYHSYYLGKKNNLGQIYMNRNALFEPSLFKLNIKDPIVQCLTDMAIAFRMNKPVLISSHRINYVGFIDETNRNRTHKLLHQLLSTALKKWPDIEFMNSSQLGHIILNHGES
jgi:hypothetical protein